MGLGCSPWGHKESDRIEQLSLSAICPKFAVIFTPLIIFFFCNFEHFLSDLKYIGDIKLRLLKTFLKYLYFQGPLA